MFAKKIILSLTALLALNTIAAAQILGGNTGTMSGGGTPSTSLPSSQTGGASYNRSIGNDWLGGSVFANVQMQRQKTDTYQRGALTMQFRGNASVLHIPMEVAEVYGNLTNVMNGNVQTRSGAFRVQLMGFNVVNNSFTNSSTFAAASHSFNLFPGDGVSASVPLGPGSITLSANAGCGYSRSANWHLPAYTINVGVIGEAHAHAFANASVSYGIPGFNAGVGVEGRLFQKSIEAGVSASALSGLSGNAEFRMSSIDLRLYCWLTAFWVCWDTTLCQFGGAAATMDLF